MGGSPKTSCTDAETYERVWEDPRYRKTAPGEAHVERFLSLAHPYGEVIDFGCGTGRAAAAIASRAGVRVTALDFAANAPDNGEVQAGVPASPAPDVPPPNVTFRVHDLRNPLSGVAPFGFCTDVLEHIAPEDVEGVLLNALTAARRVYLAISTVPDHFGPALLGEPLHLTVRPHDWWKGSLESLGARIDYEEDLGSTSVFYTSIYASGADYLDQSHLNVSEAKVEENILANLGLGFSEACPHEAQETEVILLAGGPSLADFEDEIVRRGKGGTPVITVNGTYGWAIERGIAPAAQFMVDARDFNARFVQPILPTCRYVFSSQASHAAARLVPPKQGWLFHSGDAEIVKKCLEVGGQAREWYPIFGGSTVVGRALVVLAMLGLRNVEVFGWDSCLRGESHHAYPQAENDASPIVDVEIGGRWFKCHPWMVVQAHEMPLIIRHILAKVEGFNLNVRGDGLIAHMLNTAATRAEKGI
jgi:SAM-dependent methyltransferase